MLTTTAETDSSKNWRARLAVSLARRQSSSGQADWDSATGETPLQWAQRVGVPEQDQLAAYADTLGVEFAAELKEFPASPRFVEEFPINYARRHAILGLVRNGGISLAVGHLESWPQLDIVRRLFRCAVTPIFAPPDEIQRLINIAYQQRSGEAQNLIESLDRSTVLSDVAALTGREDLLDVAGRAPVIRLVNLMLFEAVKGGASDVHIQPYEDRLVVRFRRYNQKLWMRS
jgi:general secretion pathway protein E